MKLSKSGALYFHEAIIAYALGSTFVIINTLIPKQVIFEGLLSTVHWTRCLGDSFPTCLSVKCTLLDSLLAVSNNRVIWIIRAEIQCGAQVCSKTELIKDERDWSLGLMALGAHAVLCASSMRTAQSASRSNKQHARDSQIDAPETKVAAKQAGKGTPFDHRRTRRSLICIGWTVGSRCFVQIFGTDWDLLSISA